jgi:hypothetical protein
VDVRQLNHTHIKEDPDEKKKSLRDHYYRIRYVAPSSPTTRLINSRLHLHLRSMSVAPSEESTSEDGDPVEECNNQSHGTLVEECNQGYISHGRKI